MIYGDPERYYGEPGGFVAWDGAHIVRTASISAATPTWEQIDSGISGDLIDVQAVVPDSGSIGAWALTTAGVYWCEDIEAESPAWTQKLSLATVQAADATPTDTEVRFFCMAAHPTEPGYLIVITGPAHVGDGGGNTDYAHAYSWHTHDFGANWTQVDMDDFLLETSDEPLVQRGYCYSSARACEIGADGTIYVIRAAPVVGVGSNMRVFTSSDLGDNWAQGYALPSLLNNRNSFSLTAPQPETSDPGYALQGSVGTSNRPDTHRTTDAWANGTNLGDPTGYGGAATADFKPARRYNDANHVRGWYRESSSATHLLASDDQGATWASKFSYNPGLGISYDTTALNWPPDPDLWVIVANRGPAQIANVVRLTDDDFDSSPVDKSGNLEAVLGTWTQGLAGGFFIPKPPIPIDRYMVGDGADLMPSQMSVLDPPPRCRGVRVTRRSESHNNRHLDEALWILYEYDMVGSEAEYQELLTQWGLMDSIQNEVTCTARDADQNWQRWTGIATRPEMGVDVVWQSSFPRSIGIVVRDVRLAE